VKDLQEGLCNASKNESLIHKWWDRWPDANIAVATGNVSGFIVLDVNVGQGYDGNDTLKDLEAQYGKLPDTVELLTGTGGRHILFADSGLVLRNNIKLAAGLNIRANGGCIVVPPSTHETGNEYAWGASFHPDDAPLAWMPVWLVKMIFEKTSVQNHSHSVYEK
jgi:hypothetical protein